MKKEGVRRPPYVAYFFIFGTVGGWFLARALSPSGLAATCTVALVTAAPLALLASAIAMTQEQERSIYHRIVLWTGFGYPSLLASFAAFAALYSRVI